MLVSNAVDTATVEDAVSWAMMAEDCKLSKLRMQALRQVARALATKPCGPSQPRCGSAKSGSIYSYSLPAAVKSPNVNQIVASTSALKVSASTSTTWNAGFRHCGVVLCIALDLPPHCHCCAGAEPGVAAGGDVRIRCSGAAGQHRLLPPHNR